MNFAHSFVETKDVNECSNIRIFVFHSNTISEFEYSHFYQFPCCASSKFSNEEL